MSDHHAAMRFRAPRRGQDAPASRPISKPLHDCQFYLTVFEETINMIVAMVIRVTRADLRGNSVRHVPNPRLPPQL